MSGFEMISTTLVPPSEPLDASFLNARLEGSQELRSDRRLLLVVDPRGGRRGAGRHRRRGTRRLQLESLARRRRRRQGRAGSNATRVVRVTSRTPWGGCQAPVQTTVRPPSFGKNSGPCSAGQILRVDPRKGRGHHASGWTTDVVPRKRERDRRRVSAQLRARLGRRLPRKP